MSTYEQLVAKSNAKKQKYLQALADQEASRQHHARQVSQALADYLTASDEAAEAFGVQSEAFIDDFCLEQNEEQSKPLLVARNRRALARYMIRQWTDWPGGYCRMVPRAKTWARRSTA